MVIQWCARWAQNSSGPYVSVSGKAGEWGDRYPRCAQLVSHDANSGAYAIFVDVPLGTLGQLEILRAMEEQAVPAFLAEHPEFDEAATMRGEVVL